MAFPRSFDCAAALLGLHNVTAEGLLRWAIRTDVAGAVEALIRQRWTVTADRFCR